MAKYGRRFRLFGQKSQLRPVGGFSGLFDQFGYPAFGASMRLLGKNYTGGLVRVRAFDGSSDQGTADIMPYKIGDEYWVDLNSTLENLDATAIGRGLTTSDTLGDLLSSGVSNYDGFVTTMYNQGTTGSLNLSQPTAANQPQIASAGVITTLNDIPAIDTNNGKYLSTNSFASISQPITIFSVHKTSSTSGIVLGSESSGNERILIYTGGSSGKTFFSGATLRDSAYEGLNEQLLETFLVNTPSSVVRSNGAQIISGNSGNNTLNRISVGAYSDGSFNGNCEIQEAIYYFSDKTSDFENIESNINNAFSIYP